MAEIRLSPAFLAKLENIHRYILEEAGSPLAAEKTVSKILKRIRLLEEIPESGTVLSALYPKAPKRFQNTRLLMCDPYVVVYDFEEPLVLVLEIYHSRQDYISHLFGTDS